MVPGPRRRGHGDESGVVARAGRVDALCRQAAPHLVDAYEAVPEKASQYDAITVPVDTMDHLAEEMDLVDDVFIKIDTEGWDLEVIRGGAETLRRATAVMVESVFYPNPLGDSAPTFEDILTALRDLGYVYRGNVRVGCHHGTPMLADVLFVTRDAAERMVELA